jgi:hypothetical protein
MLVSLLEEGRLLRLENLIFRRFRCSGLKIRSEYFIEKLKQRMIVIRHDAAGKINAAVITLSQSPGMLI